MKVEAIVYTSKTGHTKRYAEMLANIINIKAYSLEDAKLELKKSIPIIYLGYIHASHINKYSYVEKQFKICAVCGVGLCDNGTKVNEVRKATNISSSIPLFTLQGGINKKELKGLDKMLISMLIKGFSKQKNRSDEDERMFELLTNDSDYVKEENLNLVLQWYKE